MLWVWSLACIGDTSIPESTSVPTDDPTSSTTPTPLVTSPTIDTATAPTVPAGPQSVLQFTGAPPSNLLIVSLDTTRRDYSGRFSGTDNTPNLDELLATGVVLENHRSCSSWTPPSMTCVTTGLSPFELNWWPWAADPQVPGFNGSMPTLAGQFTFQKKYRTALVTANNLFGPDFALDRGFETLFGPYWSPADVVANEALEAAQGLMSAGGPFYLHVHFIDPHGSYCPPDDFVDASDYVALETDLCNNFYELAWTWNYQSMAWQDTMKNNAQELYDAELEFWDDEFGKMWDEFDTMGLLDDTLVVFVTDHGEQFFERNGYGHGNTLYAEENRSTAMFWAKNIVPQAWTGLTVHQDIAATLQDYFDIEAPIPVTGTVVGLRPEDEAVRGFLYWGPGSARLAIARGHQQLTYDFWGEKHFWDTELDPTGMIDYYDPQDPDVIELWGPMTDFIDEVVDQWPSVGTPVDPVP